MAKQESLRTSECPVARTLESIGERWCLMIIREAFDDVRRFSEFQKNLGLAKKYPCRAPEAPGRDRYFRDFTGIGWQRI